MNTEFQTYLERFQDSHILIIGETMLDVYLDGHTDRLCREAPVPIVSVQHRTEVPGGAANTAANLAALGAQVKFMSAVGLDQEGSIVLSRLADLQVDIRHIQRGAIARTITKQRVTSDGQLLLRFDYDHSEPLLASAKKHLLRELAELYPTMDAVIISDYGYGLLDQDVLDQLARLQAAHPRPLIIDAKDLVRYRSLQPTAVKPNYGEAAALLKLDQDHTTGRVEQIESHRDALLALTGAKIVATTLDTQGALVLEAGRPVYRTYARPTQHSKAAGAGDTFTATLALALAAGANGPEAAELASAAAAVVVAKDGTTRCSLSELDSALSTGTKCISDRQQLAQIMNTYHREGRRIVFTNGCFDILHSGHVAYLNQAKSRGDVLIVGLNSDDSIRRLKGPERPINHLTDRIQVLSALSCIDHVAPFGEDTAAELIKLVRPDVFIKGGDYTPDTILEAPLVTKLGGQVEVLPFVPGKSTTNLIHHIRANSGSSL